MGMRLPAAQSPVYYGSMLSDPPETNRRLTEIKKRCQLYIHKLDKKEQIKD